MIKTPGFENEYIIQDQKGSWIRLDIKMHTFDKIVTFHSGSVVSVDTSPYLHSMASLGADGTVRVYEYYSKTLIGQASYSSGGSFLTYLPHVIFIS